MSFEWDGSTLTTLVEDGSFGTTHRDLIYRYGPGQTVRHVCNQRDQTATGARSASLTGDSTFRLGFSSANPLVPFAPTVDSTIEGTMNGAALKLTWQHDQFPSQGVRVTRNGVELGRDVFDASCIAPVALRPVAGLLMLRV